MCGALTGLGDCIASGWIDLSRAAAGDHAYVRMGANHGYGVQADRNQRERRSLILEQHNATLFDFARNIEANEGIDHAALAGVIDDTGSEHGAQNAVYMLIEFG